MAVDWYTKDNEDFALTKAEVKDLMINAKSQVNSLKNNLAALKSKLTSSKLDLTTEEKQDLLAVVGKFENIYNAIVTEGF